jgi:plasmid stabilization system protein ParE
VARTIEFHPEAAEEMASAYDWYHKRSESAARALLLELDLSLRHIAEAPDIRPLTHALGVLSYPGFLSPSYYLTQEAVIEVVAIAHHKRRPGYWKSRL